MLNYMLLNIQKRTLFFGPPHEDAKGFQILSLADQSDSTIVEDLIQRYCLRTYALLKYPVISLSIDMTVQSCNDISVLNDARDMILPRDQLAWLDILSTQRIRNQSTKIFYSISQNEITSLPTTQRVVVCTVCGV